MAKWVLYHTDGCHLCEQAEQLVTDLLDTSSSLELVDIITDEQLINKYQTRIPVLKSEQGLQLYWPFSAHSAREFMTQAD
ncbi:MAG: glutaredoxin family protein [Pseudoalteromonas sp.]|jgi:hypothetical protein|uniref:glutaredoxin family protein n=1 Tax=unclassified Pseudoalteromonas TaxID=194690 RepID=UPI001B37244D|nr:glutaredoxin family protein [Pseudoalteromonas sp. MMG007]MBQ4857429.1 glutaredoxin family protein [Pseudoalteromonas sp. MMG007]|tara:strand:+ start:228 stop:467 length:240 start_codon:yes stop_codon:yes gene_type:complete